MFTKTEYDQLMREAREEFLEWEREKRKVKKVSKEKYKAQRLAKLHMMEMKN